MLGWSTRKNLSPRYQGTDWKVSGFWSWNVRQNTSCSRSPQGRRWHSQEENFFQVILEVDSEYQDIVWCTFCILIHGPPSSVFSYRYLYTAHIHRAQKQHSFSELFTFCNSDFTSFVSWSCLQTLPIGTTRVHVQHIFLISWSELSIYA